MTDKWTIKKLNQANGDTLVFPWHVIPPGFAIPPRDASFEDLANLYRTHGGRATATHPGAIAYAHNQIREAADGTV